MSVPAFSPTFCRLLISPLSCAMCWVNWLIWPTVCTTARSRLGRCCVKLLAVVLKLVARFPADGSRPWRRDRLLGVGDGWLLLSKNLGMEVPMPPCPLVKFGWLGWTAAA